jgi:hypothetical protein
MIFNIKRRLLKSFFNPKEHKEGTKYTKLKPSINVLCDLCEMPL